MVPPLSKTTFTSLAASLRMKLMVPLLLVIPEAYGCALAEKAIAAKAVITATATFRGTENSRAIKNCVLRKWMSSNRETSFCESCKT